MTPALDFLSLKKLKQRNSRHVNQSVLKESSCDLLPLFLLDSALCGGCGVVDMDGVS